MSSSTPQTPTKLGPPPPGGVGVGVGAAVGDALVAYGGGGGRQTSTLGKVRRAGRSAGHPWPSLHLPPYPHSSLSSPVPLARV